MRPTSRACLRAVVVGINPASVSVAEGHYYQGFVGQRFLTRLRAAGITGEAERGREDDAAFRADIGFYRPREASDRKLKGTDGRRVSVREQASRPNAAALSTTARRVLVRGAATGVFGPFDGNGFVAGLRLGPSIV
jgi:G:T/U-mismatch repair DNA glycosylase